MSWSDWPFVAVLAAWLGVILYACRCRSQAPPDRRPPAVPFWTTLLKVPAITCYFWSLQHAAEYPRLSWVLLAVWGVLVAPTLLLIMRGGPAKVTQKEHATAP